MTSHEFLKFKIVYSYDQPCLLAHYTVIIMARRRRRICFIFCHLGRNESPSKWMDRRYFQNGRLPSTNWLKFMGDFSMVTENINVQVLHPDDIKELKYVQEQLEIDISTVLDSEGGSPTEKDSLVSTRGRKLKRTPRMLQYEGAECSLEEENDDDDDDSEDEVVKKSVKKHKSSTKQTGAKTSTPACSTPKTQVAAKLCAKQTLCKEIFGQIEASTVPTSDSLNPSSYCPTNSRETFANDMDDFTGLEGIARAVEVANNSAIEDSSRPERHSFINMDLQNHIDTIHQLQSDMKILEEENVFLSKENYTLKEKNASLEKRYKLLSAEVKKLQTENQDNVQQPRPVDFDVTPRKIKFLKDIASHMEDISCLKDVEVASSSNTSRPPIKNVAPSQLPELSCTTAASSSSESQSIQEPTAEPAPENLPGETSAMVELVKGTGVFIQVKDRTSILLKGKKGTSMMFRKILDILFSKEEQANGCAVGRKTTGVMGNQHQPLDSKRMSAAKAFMLLYCKKHGIPVPSEKELNCIANSKCVSTRRQEKKAKPMHTMD
ncbi:Nucleus accumbens-associated protein 2 [Holothuria leucospilota]|uniref:Nucleus accumbens-associated protein 2 n=1 Tax=Holothuria leucospilota TaxID=206669 RepID=A0A9Q1HGR8_HOLLE|nr:Nucleus accumbens-associated protein 2 [Holothuria leucospilota]